MRNFWVVLQLLLLLSTNGFCQEQKSKIVLSTKVRKELADRLKQVYRLTDDVRPEEVPSVVILARPPHYSKGNPKPGDSAEGIILLESSDELYLDTTPCESAIPRKQIYTFRSPYKKQATSKRKTCSSTSPELKMVKITQKGKK